MKRFLLGNLRARRRGVSRSTRLLRFASCEPRCLLAVTAFEPIQTIYDENGFDARSSFLAFDIDRDGDPDGVGYGADELVVFENHLGHFARREATDSLAIPESLASSVGLVGAADWDGDQDLDLLVELSGLQLAWVENIDGQGTFRDVHWVPEQNSYVAAADFDSDGDVDLLTRQYLGEGDFRWYENVDARGSMLRSHDLPMGHAEWIEVADLDGDADVDVVSLEADVLTVWENRGHSPASWIRASSVALPANLCSRLKLIDLNADQQFEAIIDCNSAIWRTNSLSPSADVRLHSLAPELSAFSTAWYADLNGDQLSDAIGWNQDTTFWMPQLPNGQFGAMRPILSSTSSRLTMVDVDGDRDLDITIALNDRLQWLENVDGSGDFGTTFIEEGRINLFGFGNDVVWGRFESSALRTISMAYTQTSYQVYDWSGDGLDDLLVETEVPTARGPLRQVRWFPNQGGVLGEGQTLLEVRPPAPGPLSFSDLNPFQWFAGNWMGDERPELVVSVDKSLTLYSSPAFDQPVTATVLHRGRMLKDLLVADLDHDGDDDLLGYFSIGDGAITRNQIIWFEHQGNDLGFAPLAVLAENQMFSHWSWQDATGDGLPELVSLGSYWTFDPLTRTLQLQGGQPSVTTYDLNHDGYADFPYQNQAGEMFIAWGQEDATQNRPVDRITLPAHVFWESTDPVIDIDADGDLDFLLRNVATAEHPGWGWLENDQMTHEWHYRSQNGSEVAEVSAFIPIDLEGDGDHDLVTLHGEDLRLRVWRNVQTQYDLSYDGRVDIQDLVTVCEARSLFSNEARFDLDHNGSLNNADVDWFRSHILGQTVGDVDDDGRFDSSDVVQLMQNGIYRQLAGPRARWIDGDFDCDGRFDENDLNLAYLLGDYPESKEQPDVEGETLSSEVIWNGHEEFPPKFSPYSYWATQPVSGDIDGDGNDELLLASALSQVWYRRDGDNPLQPIGVYELLGARVANALADLDGDQDLDWIAAGGTTFWYENTGVGQFNAKHQIDQRPLFRYGSPRTVDWDRDGDLDIVLIRDDSTNLFVASLVVYENTDGRGTFQESIVVRSQSRHGSINTIQAFDLADIDSDGWTDLVMGNDGWYRNLQGSFQQVNRMPIDGVPFVESEAVSNLPPVVAIDLDQDGDADLLQQNETGHIVFSYNDGRGHFQHFVSDISAQAFFVSDVDANHRLELITFVKSRVTWYEADLNWSDASRAGFLDAHDLPAASPSFAMFDRDGDDRPELVMLANGFGVEPQFVVAHHGQTDLVSWDETSPLLRDDRFSSIHRSDVDADGTYDIVLYSDREHRYSFLRQTEDGQWSEPQELSAEQQLWADYQRTMGSIDLDADGDLDLASSNFWLENTGPPAGPEWTVHWLPVDVIDWVDMDHDGDWDLLSEQRWLANERGTFDSAAPNLLDTAITDHVWAAADVNSDGHVDLFTIDAEQRVSLYLGEGAGWGKRQEVYQQWLFQRRPVLWDADGDGDRDLVDSPDRWFENELGTFVRSHRSSVGQSSYLVDQIVADFDGDGNEEFVTAWSLSNDVVVTRPAKSGER